MYVETVPNRNSPPAILLREGRREGKKVHKRTLANLTHWPKDKIERLRRVLKNEPLVHPDQLFLIERSLPHGHVEILLEVVRKLKLPALIDPRPSPQRDRVLAMILQRLLFPASKLATTRLWHTTTLGEELSLEDTDEDDLYEAMDWLLQRQDRIERKLAKRHLAEGDPVLYDVSSSYYEGRTCPLMQFGHNRDGKRDRPIVVYGVLADSMGRPLAVQAYAGNTGDPTTVPDQVEKIRGRFGLQRVVLVGDRGLLTETQINHLKRHPGLGWVSALRHHQIRRLVESEAVQLSLFDERHLAEVRSPDYPRRTAHRLPQPAAGRASAAEAGGVAGGHRRGAGPDCPPGGQTDPHALVSDGDRRETRPRQEPLPGGQTLPDPDRRRVLPL